MASTLFNGTLNNKHFLALYIFDLYIHRKVFSGKSCPDLKLSSFGQIFNTFERLVLLSKHIQAVNLEA